MHQELSLGDGNPSGRFCSSHLLIVAALVLVLVAVLPFWYCLLAIGRRDVRADERRVGDGLRVPVRLCTKETVVIVCCSCA